MRRDNRNILGLGFAAMLAAACSSSTTPSGSSQTHWLKACASDGECGDALSCVCDVCVASCDAASPCSVPGRATSCMGSDAPSVQALCGGAAPSMVCLEPCPAGSCGAGERCEAGACVPDPDAVGAGSGGGGAGAGGAGSGSSGSGGGGAGAGGSAGGGAAGAGGAGDESCPSDLVLPAICMLCADNSCGVPTCSGGQFVAFVCPDDGAAGAGGTGGTGGGACVPEGDACTIVGSDPDPCCAGTACSSDVCTDSIPGMCSGTCQSSSGGGNLAWYQTCGDPVCGPPTPVPVGQECTTQTEGAPCTQEGASCLTGSCGTSFLCTGSDPKLQPGGCPISRARFKRDIAYVDEAERRAYAEELLSLPLATYRYREDASGLTQLGFVLEDVEPSMSVDSARDRVNLYGYTSMAVAAIQEQGRQIEALGRELDALRGYVADLENQCR